MKSGRNRPGAQFIAAVDTRWLRRRLFVDSANASAFGTKLDTIAPLLEKSHAYVISVETSAGITVDVRALTSGADDAKPVAETMQAVLTLARNAVDGFIQESAVKPAGEPMKSAMAAAGSLLSQTKIETSENVVHLQAKSPLELSELMKSLAPALATARVAAGRAQSINNLKQIGLAFHNYAQTNNHLPPPALLGGDQNKFPYSWRVALLPYLDQDALYREYRFDEPWDGPNNSKLIDRMPRVFSVPGPGGAPLSRSKSSYYVFTGPTTALGSPWVPGGQNAEPTGFPQIADGTSNTILAVEWDGNVPWTKPVDIPFDPDGAVPALGGFWADEFNVLMCDGSVRGAQETDPPQHLESPGHAIRRRGDPGGPIRSPSTSTPSGESLARKGQARPMPSSGGRSYFVTRSAIGRFCAQAPQSATLVAMLVY